MEVEFLTGDGVERAIKRLITEHDQFHWAVAWGTYTPLAKELVSHSDKIRRVTFGLAFAQTDPDLVEALIGVRGCYVVTEFPGGTFHPKVYAFRSGNRAAVVLGSANFTRGGLGNNHEASVLITGSTDEHAIAEVLAYTKRCAGIGKTVTTELARRYRLSYRLAAQRSRPARDPLANLPSASSGNSSQLVGMDWAQYVRAVRSSAYHRVDTSLKLLRTAQAWLSGAASFHDLMPPQQKAIAGVIGRLDKARDTELNQDWGWFGSMRGAGDFMNRIAENDRFLARAVDSVPQRGEVRRDDFDRFARYFVRAFANSDRTGGVATGSRLLAMKRPDVFLCLSKPNITAAAKELGFAKSTINLENYWDRVVEVIRASDWYNVEKPEGPDAELWECRAAMLDAIFYRPG